MMDGRGEINQLPSKHFIQGWDGGIKNFRHLGWAIVCWWGSYLARANGRVSTLSSLPAQDGLCQYHNGTSRYGGTSSSVVINLGPLPSPTSLFFCYLLFSIRSKKDCPSRLSIKPGMFEIKGVYLRFPQLNHYVQIY